MLFSSYAGALLLAAFLFAAALAGLDARVEGRGGTAFGTVFSLLNIAFSLGLMAGPILGDHDD